MQQDTYYFCLLKIYKTGLHLKIKVPLGDRAARISLLNNHSMEEVKKRFHRRQERQGRFRRYDLAFKILKHPIL
jgi:hypothetical protein